MSDSIYTAQDLEARGWVSDGRLNWRHVDHGSCNVDRVVEIEKAKDAKRESESDA